MSEQKAKYRVRGGFTLHLRSGADPLEAGTELELTEAEAQFYAAQIELIEPVKAKAVKARTNGAG